MNKEIISSEIIIIPKEIKIGLQLTKNQLGIRIKLMSFPVKLCTIPVAREEAAARETRYPYLEICLRQDSRRHSDPYGVN